MSRPSIASERRSRRKDMIDDFFDTYNDQIDNRPNAEEAAEILLDSFKNDPLYVAAFEHGEFGDIDDATLEIFGDVKIYIADTIFATQNQNDQESNNSNSDYDYEPTSSDEPKYLDVSEYYKNKELNLPKLYREPGAVTMPSILMKHQTRFSKPGEGDWLGYKIPTKMEFEVDDDYPVKHADTNYPSYQEQKGEKTKKQKRWTRNVKEIIGKDQDWKKWAQVAGVTNLNSRNDSDMIKKVFRENKGVLPQDTIEHKQQQEVNVSQAYQPSYTNQIRKD